MTKVKTFTIDADNIGKLTAKVDSLFADKEVEIKGAAINDALCNYSYELLMGKTKGDTLTHKGAHIIHDDLQRKFDSLSVFLAHIDDAYTGNSNTTPLGDLEQESETEKYYVTGFRISGTEENRAVTLSGWKEVTEGVINFSTPKIKYTSAYLYLSYLKERIQEVIDEVEEYRNGKTAPQDDPDQIHMDFESQDDAFDKAKLD